jgi:hypothetical protein
MGPLNAPMGRRAYGQILGPPRHFSFFIFLFLIQHMKLNQSMNWFACEPSQRAKFYKNIFI